MCSKIKKIKDFINDKEELINYIELNGFNLMPKKIGKDLKTVNGLTNDLKFKELKKV